MKDIILWGAAGQAIVLEEFLGKLGYRIVALFDNNRAIQSPFESVPLYYEMNGFEGWISEKGHATDTSYIVTIANQGEVRLNIHKKLESFGLIPILAVHPTSFIADNASVGDGCQVLADAAICARASVGVASIINTSATIEHECVLGNGVHIATGAKLSGGVEVRDFSFIGTGAIILPRVHIGKRTIIGAGSVVTGNIPDNVVAYGNPAKVIRDNDM